MKNIHIIPTDNYSDLVHSTNKYGGYFLSIYYSPMKDMGDSYQNIYITNSEKIKEEGYVFWEGKVYKYREFMKMRTPVYTDYFSIILTTDVYLIKDGVQAIDDEFLEWFVKNPTCEFVEVNEKLIIIQNKPLVQHQGNKPIVVPHRINYKIIIPQEEPKQYTSEELEGFEDFKKMIKPKQETLEEFTHENINGCIGSNGLSDPTLNKVRQETVEEAAKNYANYNEQVNKAIQEAVKFGAKLQAERMYSEEEVRGIIKIYSHADNELSIGDILKQFKNR